MNNNKLRVTQKTYWAVVKNKPPKQEDNLVHFLKRNQQNNTSKAHLKEIPDYYTRLKKMETEAEAEIAASKKII